MLLASIILLFSLLALGLLALLDRFDGATLKAQSTRNESNGKFQYYDAFSDRRESADRTNASRIDSTKRDVAA